MTLWREKSRITIFGEPVICNFCTHDVFIPYEVYVNVEQPSIDVRYVRRIAICQHCGQAKIFIDPSGFDDETNTYIWALNQYSISDRKFKIKIIFYIGKRHDDKLSAFLNNLKERHIEIESVHRVKTEVTILATTSSLNELQTVRSTIMNSAKLLKVTIKNLIIN